MAIFLKLAIPEYYMKQYVYSFKIINNILRGDYFASIRQK